MAQLMILFNVYVTVDNLRTNIKGPTHPALSHIVRKPDFQFPKSIPRLAKFNARPFMDLKSDPGVRPLYDLSLLSASEVTVTSEYGLGLYQELYFRWHFSVDWQWTHLGRKHNFNSTFNEALVDCVIRLQWHRLMDSCALHIGEPFPRF